ncbi:MAG: NAD+ synthase [Nitrososphaerota archaeon]|nr:NAD+ synthase [Nitrososphaerota archaeon]
MASVPKIRASEAEKIASFIGEVVEGASAKGAVVALSGGIDSSVVGALCVKALGREKVLGLLLPSDHTPEEDTKDARSLADSWGIETKTVPITGVVKSILASVDVEGTRVARGNLEARTRMVISYFYANNLSYLVAGTGDRSELALGYFTKFGDGGVDFLPIAHLYKTQVRQLGAHLGLPRRLVEKPASPQLWKGQKATDEIPAEYDKLDAVLSSLLDLKAHAKEAAFRGGVPVSVAEKALEMHRRSAHKRAMAVSLLDDRQRPSHGG